MNYKMCVPCLLGLEGPISDELKRMDIADVSAMLAAAKTFGAKVTRDVKGGSVTITTPKVRTAKIDASLSASIRTKQRTSR